jgi:SAM-dependent methyltransferase
VADVGSGTGISADLLLKLGALVYAVEPNAEMRQSAEAQLGGLANFRSVDGRAEATGLLSESVDAIVAGQAFHWFDRAAARREFIRILKPDGWLVLMWNDRLSEGTPFLEGYERLMTEYMPEYVQMNHRNVSAADLSPFFQGDEMKICRFANSQAFDFEGLTGRVLSSSYAPEPGDPHHEPMMAALRKLFQETETDGRVHFLYETQVFYGHL